MIGLLNLGSLMLGLIAWIFPVINIKRFLYKKHEHRNWVVFSIMSISACATSLCFQIFYNYYLVKIGDWSALMDIMGAVTFLATGLLIVTITLNLITLILYRDRTVK